MDVLVIGAGVIGLTTAVSLARAGLSVLVRTAEPPRLTTSAVAGAMAGGPVFAEPVEAARRWQRIGLEEFAKLAGDARTGVRIAMGRLVSRMGEGIPPWAERLPGFRPCTPEESAGFPVAFWISSPLVSMPPYLAYLVDLLAEEGGRIEVRPVAGLDEAAAEAPVVVNCSGLGARQLAADPEVRPVRGQHVVVENPGLHDFFYEGGAETEWTGYMPHRDRVVLGGTATADDWRKTPDPQQTEDILRRCAEIEPRLGTARVLAVEVGLRPSRPVIRVEEEAVAGARVIHNYGHGSVGVSMSWGCAAEVTEMVLSGGRPRATGAPSAW
ncbi:D-amino-acid oxidase [Thermocatellispora tengchongensis]|uniref:D-amino-acid oxidase n=1 Tax=Thermocatellispora tengchongensis TaxID=1073253 RepID=A0A840PB29_9ACTN|nr:FAD-dependent oxidoreductase [Thermocatellispora tengchongensis]MBB5136452.1 D-amino-acid oxidase [Thermocatellispora tengchongensis]